MTDTTLDAARRYYAEGWTPIELPYRSKKPGRKAWQDTRYKNADELADRFNGRPQNIGVLNGAPSGGRVDIDLDCDEAVALAPALLPPTPRIGGRAQREFSHYFYNCGDEAPKKGADRLTDPVLVAEKADDEKAVMLEFRSTGSQTVVAPSVGPEGDAYLWHHQGEPAEVSFRDLNATFKRLYAASLMLRYYPPAGQRHDGALRWAGLLLGCRIRQEHVEQMVEAVAHAAGDTEVRDRVTAVRTTAQRLAHDEPAVAGRSLADLLGAHGPKLVAAVKHELRARAAWAGEKPADQAEAEPEPEPEREAEAEPVDPYADVPPCTLADTLAVFDRWLYLEDRGAILALLGALAANHLEGDPVWLMLVGGSSSGKTELLQSTALLSRMHLLSTLSGEGALLSATSRKDRAKGATGGLLREIGAFGLLGLKDFTSILAMPREERGRILAAFREIYDGSWRRDVGQDGGQQLAWHGKVGLVAACTTAIDSAHSVTGMLGERFVLYRVPEVDRQEQARRALHNVSHAVQMRGELSEAVRALFAGLDLAGQPPEPSPALYERIVALANLGALCRSGVERDSHTHGVELIADPEGPARLAGTLLRLYGGLQTIGTGDGDAWRVVWKVGLDSMPKIRRTVFEALRTAEGATPTALLAAAIGYPTETTRRAAEDLSMHHIVTRTPGGGSKGDQWALSDLARGLLAICSPEMSE